MIIDCDRCVVRGRACADCVVGLLMGTPDGTGLDGELEPAVRRAVNLFAEAGMLPAADRRAVPGRAAPPGHSAVPPTRRGRRSHRPARPRRSA